MSGPENEETLESFFARLQPSLRTTLARYSMPAGEAEAVLKDVLLTLVYKRDSISSPERWLLQTVRNRCLTFWRRRRWQLYKTLDSILVEPTAETPGQPDFSRELHAIAGPRSAQSKGRQRKRYGFGDSGRAETSSPEGSELESRLSSRDYRLAERGLLEPSNQDPN